MICDHFRKRPQISVIVLCVGDWFKGSGVMAIGDPVVVEAVCGRWEWESRAGARGR